MLLQVGAATADRAASATTGDRSTVPGLLKEPRLYSQGFLLGVSQVVKLTDTTNPVFLIKT